MSQRRRLVDGNLILQQLILTLTWWPYSCKIINPLFKVMTSINWQIIRWPYKSGKAYISLQYGHYIFCCQILTLTLGPTQITLPLDKLEISAGVTLMLQDSSLQNRPCLTGGQTYGGSEPSGGLLSSAIIHCVTWSSLLENQHCQIFIDYDWIIIGNVIFTHT